MNYHPIYDEILESLDRDLEIREIHIGSSWVATVLEDGNCGICAKLYDRPTASVEDLLGKKRKAHLLGKELVRDDPFLAVLSLSAINACLNTTGRVSDFHAAADQDTCCMQGFDVAGKKVAVIGHMSRTRDQILKELHPEQVYMFDMDPARGDLPVEKEPELLPECEAVVITGTTLINHTIEEILQWSGDAVHIFTGPSVPFLPDFNSIDQIHGMVLSETEEFLAWNRSHSGSPLPYSQTFLLKTPFTDE